MAKLFELIEKEDVVTLRLPAPQRVFAVLSLTLAIPFFGFGVLWWGYQWLSSTAMLRQVTSEIAAFILLFVEAWAIRALLLELAVTTLTFERTTIGIRRAFLGISVSETWHNCYRIAQVNVVHNAEAPEYIRLEFLTSASKLIVVARRIPTDCFTRLVHLLRRKQFAYFQEGVA